MEKSQIKDFTKGNISRQLIVFSLPLFLSNLLQVVYNMVDMVVVGNALGKVGISAVSVGGDVTHFLTFIAMGFSNAGQVLIARYIGAKEQDKIGRFLSTMSAFLVTCSLVISAVGLVFQNGILRLMNTPDEAFAGAAAYSAVCMAGLIFIYGYNVVSAILRGMGDSRHPFVFISIAAILNLALDLVFVLGFHMGAGGAALATVISQAVSFLACVLFLYKNRAEFRLDIRLHDFLHWDREMLGDLVKLGTPMAIKTASIQISKLFVNSWINSYGVAVSAFAGIANKVSNISNLISALICLFPQQIFGIFTDEADVLTIADKYIPIAVMLFFGSALRAIMNALINGSGNYKINFVTAIMDGIVMRIGLAILFGLALDMKHYGFWLGDALAGFTPFWIGLVFYFTGLWKKGRKVK